MAGTIHVLFVATDRDRCSRSAVALEREDGGLEVVGATGADGVRAALDEVDVDCVVFGENPLTTQGSQLLDVVGVCRSSSAVDDDDPVPIVLFTDGTYGPGTAKATDGVTDYVRADGEDAFAHLADRVRWATSSTDDLNAEWYETLVESMEDGVLVFDEGGRIRYANGAMDEVFGVDREAYVDRPVTALVDADVLPAEDAGAVASAVEAVISGEADAREPEISVEPPGGEPRVVELHVVELPGDEGGALATVRTVTEYKRTESALRETRSKIERLHAVTDEMAGCRSERELFELTVDAADRILDVDVCGVDVVRDGQFIPRAVAGGDYPPSPVDGVAARAVESGDSVVVDDAADGDSPVSGARSMLLVPIENEGVLRATTTGTGAFDERDRDLAELLVAHVGETLTRIRVGKTLRERQADLMAERERLVALFESVPSPVVSYEFEDDRPVIRDANPSFETVFGVDVDRVLGDPLGEHVRPPEDDEPLTPLADLREELRSGEHVEASVRRDTADGPRDFLLHAGPLDQTDGAGYITYTDITEHRRQDRAVERQDDRIDEFTDVVEGPLRESLNEARGYLELALETGDPEDAAEVRRAHERMNRLVETLTDLGDDGSGIDETAVRPVEVGEIASRAWARVETGGVNLAVEDGTVEADPDQLEQLLVHLVRNAVDHAGETDPLAADVAEESSLTVRVGPLPDGGLYVEDTGVGIPEDERDAVFELGYSTAEGAGVGLSVVDRIAAAHDWATRVCESHEGGARFEFVPETTSWDRLIAQPSD